MERLKAKLEDRDRQLREQASALAEMESNLSELSGLIDNQDALQLQQGRRGSMEDKDAASLRAQLREKNDKIAMLTAEFDAHRADFRSTIDTLEMASSETERVYEKRIEELMQEIHELQDRTADVDNVASQLKQLEELVQELEEGLEDARRGEAEARGEVEFLRGEVERTRSELRREREKAQAAMNGSPNGNRNSTSKDLEQKEDEIRGLKAIIHSLSRDSVPGGEEKKRAASQSFEDRVARDRLERELAELRNMLNSKSSREEELERELESLRRGSTMAGTLTNRGSVMTVGSSTNNQRSSLRDSRGTVVAVPRSPESHHHSKVMSGGAMRHSRGATLDTMPESDAYSTATENSTLWCEICETAGHDILTCSNMFGPNAAQNGAILKEDEPDLTAKDAAGEAVAELSIPNMHDDHIKPAPLSPMKAKPAALAPSKVKILPNPMESGPVAGKESGVVDASKWCALCERDGHDSVDCPFEDAF
jgi:myosin heavy subunit